MVPIAARCQDSQEALSRRPLAAVSISCGGSHNTQPLDLGLTLSTYIPVLDDNKHNDLQTTRGHLQTFARQRVRGLLLLERGRCAGAHTSARHHSARALSPV